MPSAGVEPTFQASEACVLSIALFSTPKGYKRCYINELYMFEYIPMRVIPVNDDTKAYE